MSRKEIILGVIPARGGSKGVRNKNIRKLGRRPLICHTISQAQRSRMLDKIIVSTDETKIASLARKCGAEVPFIRPRFLARGDTPMLPVVQHAVKSVELTEGRRVGIVVLLQPTSPLRTAADIDAGIRKILASKADSVVSVCKLEYLCNPLLVKKVKGDRLSPYLRSKKVFTRRQDMTDLYRLNGALYIVRRDVIMNGQTFFGKDTRALVMDRVRSVDIDTALDFMIAEAIIRRAGKMKL
ncbi:cytidylyltransferase domain-containing protein [Candidatus Omnitrophota bacterium]